MAASIGSEFLMVDVKAEEGLYTRPSNSEQDEDDLQWGTQEKKPIKSLNRLKSLSSSSRDVAFLSPALSNGYDGDDSFLNRLEIKEGGNFSDLKTTTPASRYSWCSRLDHPSSVSFSSHASCSAVSFVIHDAEKCPLERYAMVTLNVSSYEQKQDPSSSNLGKMLAIPLVKKEERIDRPVASSCLYGFYFHLFYYHAKTSKEQSLCQTPFPVLFS